MLPRAVLVPLAILSTALLGPATGAAPFHRAEDLFPPEKWHNHGSCVVEAPGGGLFAAWFHGSGERKSDDVLLQAARLPQGASNWTPRFTLADTPGYPDCNPALHVDSQGRLWLFYPTILDHHWEGALLKFRVSSDWETQTPPHWDRSEVLHLTPGPEFTQGIARVLPDLERRAAASEWDATTKQEVSEYLVAMRSHATNELYQRLGWMPRAHPLAVDGRLVLGLYHDGFSFSLMAITDDDGEHWHSSAPLIGGGNIQPSLLRRRDGALVTFMRDNGPPPKRLMTATSADRGETWSAVVDSAIPNPGSGAEVISLGDGTWAYIGNDSESGRHSLAVWLSDDEGLTWKRRRHLENDPSGKESFAYPSLIQTRDGLLHATYSLATPAGETIRHAAFNVEWVAAGDPGPP